jgi:hypothetical protein
VQPRREGAQPKHLHALEVYRLAAPRKLSMVIGHDDRGASVRDAGRQHHALPGCENEGGRNSSSGGRDAGKDSDRVVAVLGSTRDTAMRLHANMCLASSLSASARAVPPTAAAQAVLRGKRALLHAFATMESFEEDLTLPRPNVCTLAWAQAQEAPGEILEQRKRDVLAVCEGRIENVS